MGLSRSEQMSRIRGAHTTPERTLRSAMWSAGLRGYRINVRTPGGRADAAFVRHRVAVFIDGCFWHGCPEHYVRPRSRAAFWAGKLRGNVDRDRRQTAILEAAGWHVCRCWEHEVFTDLVTVVSRIRDAVRGARPQALAPVTSWRVVRVEVADASTDLERRTMEDLRDASMTCWEVRRRTTHKWKDFRPGRLREIGTIRA
jgi:DNA mismatch endonuclease (patch repair protein)